MSKLLSSIYTKHVLLRSSEQRIAGLILKVVLSMAVLYFIAVRVQSAEVELSISAFIKARTWGLEAGLWMVSAMILMLVNWTTEVIKWRMIVISQFHISWKRALKGVLSGISFGIFTPNRTGDFLGRVLSLETGTRTKGVLLSMINGIAQTVATFAFGALGFVLFLTVAGVEQWGWIPTLGLQSLVLAAMLLILLFYYRLDVLADLLATLPFLGRLRSQLHVLGAISSTVLSRLLLLSAIRFLSFLVQYAVVFQLILPEAVLSEVLTATILTLFSITILPFLPIPDLLLRESFALGYFSIYHLDPIAVGVVVFLVWMINVAFPSLLGMFMLYTYRFFKSRT
jgi:hypothetical protein